MVASDNTSISATEIWEKITSQLEGYFELDKDGIKKNPNVWYSADFGKKYRNTITKLICDKFGAEKDHKRKAII